MSDPNAYNLLERALRGRVFYDARSSSLYIYSSFCTNGDVSLWDVSTSKPQRRDISIQNIHSLMPISKRRAMKMNPSLEEALERARQMERD